LVAPLSLDTDSPAAPRLPRPRPRRDYRRGVIDVLRSGHSPRPARGDALFPAALAGNPRAAIRFAQNRFSVTRQLGYSLDAARRALDLALSSTGCRSRRSS
jgi:type I restriction enzyme R subunit